ncbi:MAG: chromate efflux transporter [Planctomycetota bacterium]
MNSTPDEIVPSPTSPVAPELQVTYGEAFRVWLRIAVLSFGGPTAQIAVMHRILVDEKRWISEQRFLHALNYCMLLPGPEAQQLAVYIGWLLHRVKGGLTAGILFVLPGFLSILGLSILYASYHQTTLLQSVFLGLKAAIIAIVIEAIIRISKKALKNSMMGFLAAAAFVAMFLFHIPFPLVILVAGLIGWIGGRYSEHYFFVLKPQTNSATDTTAVPPADRNVSDPYYQPSAIRALRVASLFLVLWLTPIFMCWSMFGPKSVYYQEGVFFSKMAMVTFGGAYSALAYVAQQAVEVYGWVSAPEMLDGLGLAETTPGPLIMVVQFVGFLGAYRHPAPLSPLWGGILASLITTWGTFVPCFMYIFVGAPYIESLRNNKTLSTALSSITAAVVGVILNLAVWLAIKTMFHEVVDTSYGPLHILVPIWNTLNIPALGITLAACVMTFRLHWNLFQTLAVCTVAGWFFYGM